MQRIFAHDVIFEGRHYQAHIVEFDETTGHTSVFPFSEELPSTRFFSGTVEVRVEQGRLVTSRAGVAPQRLNSATP